MSKEVEGNRCRRKEILQLGVLTLLEVSDFLECRLNSKFSSEKKHKHR